MLSVMLDVGGAERGWRCRATKSVPTERGAELSFGRSSECDLTIEGIDSASRYFSRAHGRFYVSGGHWRVRREGDSELRMWFNFGAPGKLTCHGPGSNLRLVVNEGSIIFRPPRTAQDVRLRWSYAGAPVIAGDGDSNNTWLPEARLRLPPELRSPRFDAFLLVLCHRHLLKLDYTAPSVDELALWASSRRGRPLQAAEQHHPGARGRVSRGVLRDGTGRSHTLPAFRGRRHTPGAERPVVLRRRRRAL
jgi:hypothetical protein